MVFLMAFVKAAIVLVCLAQISPCQVLVSVETAQISPCQVLVSVETAILLHFIILME